MSDSFNDLKLTDRHTFAKFLDLLSQDLLNNPENRENNTLPSFLSALSAYAEDIQGFYDNMEMAVDANKADWQTFADLFKGAKVYE